MADFNKWTHESLAKFATEAAGELKRQGDEINTLKQDLRVAIDAYRSLNTKPTPVPTEY